MLVTQAASVAPVVLLDADLGSTSTVTSISPLFRSHERACADDARTNLDVRWR
jgi:hypothetical protein